MINSRVLLRRCLQFQPKPRGEIRHTSPSIIRKTGPSFRRNFPLLSSHGTMPQQPEWLIRISFADCTRPLNLASAGEGMRIGPINPRCVGETNEPSALTPEQAAAHTWTPDAKTWETIKRHSVSRAAVIYITGIPRGHKNKGLSLGRVTIETSKDGSSLFQVGSRVRSSLPAMR